MLSGERKYRKFSYRDSNFRIHSDHFDLLTEEIIRQRDLLEEYIVLHPEFRSSLVPIGLLKGAPAIAECMAAAASQTGVGPMAAVAGAIAQRACEVAIEAGDNDCIVENGGDIYAASCKPLQIALYAGANSKFNELALSFSATDLPLAICSSSSKMGRSLSFGACDLATVLAKDAALADAAATLCSNLVRSAEDLPIVSEKIVQIPGIIGVLAVFKDKIALAGKLPKLVKIRD